MKTAIVFYSYEGNSALIAETLGAALRADIFQIKTAGGKKRTGFVKYVWGAAQVLFRRKPKLLPLPADMDAYDLVILGTPVWAASPSPALAAFLQKNPPNGKKIALFCCHTGGKGNVFDKLKALLPGNTFAGEIDFINPLAENPAALKQKIDEWVKTLAA